MTKKVVGLIPVRMESTRLPGKPLVDIAGLPMVIHVYKRSLLAKSLDDVYVVTDSSEIKSIVEDYGGKVLMTRSEHETGTDRIAEAAENLDCDIVVNIQGDEALLRPEDIDKVVDLLLKDESINIAMLAIPFQKYNSPSDIKIVLDENDYIMYFSRADIPSDARTENPPLTKAYHIVPFKKEFLMKFSSWGKSALEKIEYIEYMRVLEKGYKIKVYHVNDNAISVDTKEDLEYVRSAMKTDKFFPKLYT